MATFSEFINALSTEDTEYWWENSAPKRASEKDERSNWKYWIRKGNKTLPFRFSIKNLAKTKNLELESSISNDHNRILFCEKFGFELVEKLVYDQTEANKLIQHYNQNINNHEIFQDFISYAHNVISSIDIQPAQIRSAINGTNELLFVLGMRNTLTYYELNGKSYINFIISAENHELLKDKISSTSVYTYKGQENPPLMIELNVSSWNDIPLEFLEANKEEIQNNYNSVKNGKRIRWNSDAKTTNSAIKYIAFKKLNVQNWIKDQTSQYKMSYFDIEGISHYANASGTTYNAKSK
jgi:hypothetical protein